MTHRKRRSSLNLQIEFFVRQHRAHCVHRLWANLQRLFFFVRFMRIARTLQWVRCMAHDAMLCSRSGTENEQFSAVLICMENVASDCAFVWQYAIGMRICGLTWTWPNYCTQRWVRHSYQHHCHAKDDGVNLMFGKRHWHFLRRLAHLRQFRQQLHLGESEPGELVSVEEERMPMRHFRKALPFVAPTQYSSATRIKFYAQSLAISVWFFVNYYYCRFACDIKEEKCWLS